MAVTIDDLPVHGPTPPGVNRLAMTERLLAAFAAHHLPPVHGFVNGKRVDDDPATEAVLRRWVAAGTSWAITRGRTRRSTPPPSTPIWPTYDGARTSWRGWRRARPGRCSGIRSCSRATRSRNAMVSGVFWRRQATWSPRSPSTPTTGPTTRPSSAAPSAATQSALAELRRSFVRGHVEELRRVRAVTRALAGRDVPQVLLLHAGAADADAIDELLTAFEAEGVRWVGLRAALADPFYAPATHAPVPFGSALPYVLARERGLKVDPPVWARGLEAPARAPSPRSPVRHRAATFRSAACYLAGPAPSSLRDALIESLCGVGGIGPTRLRIHEGFAARLLPSALQLVLHAGEARVTARRMSQGKPPTVEMLRRNVSVMLEWAASPVNRIPGRRPGSGCRRRRSPDIAPLAGAPGPGRAAGRVARGQVRGHGELAHAQGLTVGHDLHPLHGGKRFASLPKPDRGSSLGGSPLSSARAPEALAATIAPLDALERGDPSSMIEVSVRVDDH